MAHDAIDEATMGNSVEYADRQAILRVHIHKVSGTFMAWDRGKP